MTSPLGSAASIGLAFPLIDGAEHKPYIGLELDGLNNEIPAWDDARPVKVISWRLSTLEKYSGDYRSRGEWTSRQITDGLLCYPIDPPHGFEVNVRDIFVLEGVEYQVEEVRDLAHGFHRWHPGGVAAIKRIVPKGKP